MLKIKTPQHPYQGGIPVISVNMSGGAVKGIAPFKDNIPPYGAFANTTECNPAEYPIKQMVTIAGTQQEIIWPSSEHAFHAQKIIALKNSLPLGHKDIATLEKMLVELSKLPLLPQKTFLPRDHFDPLVNRYLGKGEDKLDYANKKAFDEACSLENWDNYNKYMKDVLRMKLEQHPELKALAKEFARNGIMPVEISQHDKKWASGKDGKGRNQLGIMLLELGNEYLQKEDKIKGPITNPRQAYRRMQNGNIPLSYDSLSQYVRKLNAVPLPGKIIPSKSAMPAPSTPKSPHTPQPKLRSTSGGVSVNIDFNNGMFESGAAKPDAYVNAASIDGLQVGSWGNLAGGLYNAIDTKDKKVFQAHWEKKKSDVRAGTAIMVKGADDKARRFTVKGNKAFIIHAGSPKLGDANVEKKLEEAYFQALENVKKHNQENPHDLIKSIAIPPLGIGIYKIEPALSAKCAAMAIERFKKQNPNFELAISVPLFNGKDQKSDDYKFGQELQKQLNAPTVSTPAVGMPIPAANPDKKFSRPTTIPSSPKSGNQRTVFPSPNAGKKGTAHILRKTTGFGSYKDDNGKSYIPDILNDLQLTDHYPIVQETSVGNVATLNLMKQCRYMPAYEGYNNAFEKEETDEEYRQRLDLLADLIADMINQDNLAVFSFQEAPDPDKYPEFYIKINQKTGGKFTIAQDPTSVRGELVTMYDSNQLDFNGVKKSSSSNDRSQTLSFKNKESGQEFLICNLHGKLDKSNSVARSIAQNTNENAGTPIITLGDTNIPVNAKARETLKGNEVKESEAALETLKRVNAGYCCVQGTLSESKGGVDTYDIISVPPALRKSTTVCRQVLGESFDQALVKQRRKNNDEKITNIKEAMRTYGRVSLGALIKEEFGSFVESKGNLLFFSDENEANKFSEEIKKLGITNKKGDRKNVFTKQGENKNLCTISVSKEDLDKIFAHYKQKKLVSEQANAGSAQEIASSIQTPLFQRENKKRPASQPHASSSASNSEDEAQLLTPNRSYTPRRNMSKDSELYALEKYLNIEKNKQNCNVVNEPKISGNKIDIEMYGTDSNFTYIATATEKRGGIEFSIQSDIPEDDEDIIIEKTCKMAVESASPNAQFDLTNTDPDKRQRVEESLRKAIAESKRTDIKLVENGQEIISTETPLFTKQSKRN